MQEFPFMNQNPRTRTRIVALGGTLRPQSSGSAALSLCLNIARKEGCEVRLITGVALNLPMYDPAMPTLPPAARAMLDALRDADGLVVASPGYHGSMSGLVKNALDYIEGLRHDARCYLDDVPVGCIVSAAGSQAGGSTLAALRSVIHSLRGWPTPLGVTFNSISSPFDQNGNCSDEALVAKLTQLTTQVILMARLLGSRRSGNTGQ